MKLGKKISSIDTKGEGVELGFEDGTTAKADLVIGADGIRSVSPNPLPLISKIIITNR